MPRVRHMLSPQREVSAPGKFSPLQSTPGGIFPLRFARKSLAHPLRKSDCVCEPDMDYGWSSNPSIELPGPSGCRQSAPGTNVHQRLKSSISGGSDET